MSEFKMSWIGHYLDNIPNIIFDVGAYDGKEALDFKSHFPQASIYAFEADPNNFDITKSRCANKGIVVEHIALSDRIASGIFYPSVGKYRGSGSILKPTELCFSRYPLMKFGDCITVSQTTIENYCESHSIESIDILHMDVQGAEHLVIKGLGPYRPSLIFSETICFGEYQGGLEYHESLEPIHEANHYKSFDDIMIKLGYRVVERLRSDTLYLCYG